MGTRANFYFYLVYTDRENESHHGLHSNTAPYVLTFKPQAEDRIYATGSCWATESEGQISLTAEISRRDKRSLYAREIVKVFSDPGRSASLGEDGLEEAYGHSCLIDLLAEKILFFPGHTTHYNAEETSDGQPWTEVVPDGFMIEWETWEYAPVGAQSYSHEQMEEQGIKPKESGLFACKGQGRLVRGHQDPVGEACTQALGF